MKGEVQNKMSFNILAQGAGHRAQGAERRAQGAEQRGVRYGL